jgi:hypothetical protein
MKKLILAACVAALGVPAFGQSPQTPPQAPTTQQQLENKPGANFSANWGKDPTGGNLSGWAQGQDAQQPGATQQSGTVVQNQYDAPPPNGQPNVDYGYYGGPSAPQSMAPTQRYGRSDRGYFGVYKLYGVPDELSMAEQERNRIRDAAVEFGRFRRQFTGSTQFWMDEHRTELAKSRYAMDEPMWRALHPPEYFGDGGYLYNTAESVGSAVVWGPPQPVMVSNPMPTPIVNTPRVESTVPASRNHTTVVPRVIAAEKPLYDAAASMNVQTSK